MCLRSVVNVKFTFAENDIYYHFLSYNIIRTFVSFPPMKCWRRKKCERESTISRVKVNKLSARRFYLSVQLLEVKSRDKSEKVCRCLEKNCYEEDRALWWLAQRVRVLRARAMFDKKEGVCSRKRAQRRTSAANCFVERELIGAVSFVRAKLRSECGSQ